LRFTRTRRGIGVAAALTAATLLLPASAQSLGFNGWIAVNNGGKTTLLSQDGKLKTPLFRRSNVDSSPIWDPGGRKIAFVSTRDGNPEIYVMNADRSNETRLTFHSGADTAPSFTLDGTQIRFIRETSGAFELYVMNVDGSDQHSLGAFTGSSPSWSPDATKIAYTAFAGAATDFDVYVADADGSNPVDISNLTGYESYPRWTPDGAHVVFGSAAGNQIVPADGSAAPEAFTFGGLPAPLPIFAPDGTAIAYGGSGEAFVRNDDGTFHKLIDNVVNPVPIAWQQSWVKIDPVASTEINFGDTVPMTLRLFFGDDTDNDVVSLYRDTDGPDAFVTQGTVDVDGKVRFVVKPSRKTTYIAKWEGDGAHAPSTSAIPLVIQVHAEALVYLSNAYGRDGKYRLYHLGRLVPITGLVLPKHPHRQLTFWVERKDRKQRWRYVTSQAFSLGKHGVVTVFFHTIYPETFRVRTTFRGDRDHLKDASDWAFFKVTN